MGRVLIEAMTGEPVWRRPFEVVERKGLGHPDSICDAVMEEAARALLRHYLDVLGAPQHFNLDKGLLAAGVTRPAFGGGRVEQPMRLIFGDRAIYEVSGRAIPVGEILEQAARSWFRTHLRWVDPDRDLVCQNEVRPGSPELTGLFAHEIPPANDTSVTVASAPMSPTERFVLEAESFLNAPETKERFPECGEDVKVMGVRRGKTLELTVAAAFVDRFIDSERAYTERKSALERALEAHLYRKLGESPGIDALTLRLNALDTPGRCAEGCYLTVTGTSAEGGDSGQVGRGNQLSGIFATRRPASNEAPAGKNPQAHVGKIYNILAQRTADRLGALDAIEEVSVYLVSRIGSRVDEPQLAAAEIRPAAGARLEDVATDVEDLVEEQLARATRIADAWLHGRV